VAMDQTITEQDLDKESRQYVNRLRAAAADQEMDLDVDGLSDSILVRLKRFFSFGRA